MDFETGLKFLLRDLKIPTVTLFDMEFLTKDENYTMGFREQGECNPTIIGFEKDDKIEIRNSGKARIIEITSPQGFVRFSRDIPEDRPLNFDLRPRKGTLLKLISEKIDFKILNGAAEIIEVNHADTQVKALCSENRVGLSFPYGSQVWINLGNEYTKIRIELGSKSGPTPSL